MAALGEVERKWMHCSSRWFMREAGWDVAGAKSASMQIKFSHCVSCLHSNQLNTLNPFIIFICMSWTKSHSLILSASFMFILTRPTWVQSIIYRCTYLVVTFKLVHLCCIVCVYFLFIFYFYFFIYFLVIFPVCMIH